MLIRAQGNYVFGVRGKWSNVWHCDAVDLDTAADVWQDEGVPQLLPLLHPSATLTTILLSSEADDTFLTRPINAAGSSASTDSLLPLFNTLKALFSSSGLGRPDYKYFKGFLTEASQPDGIIEPTLRGNVAIGLASLLSHMASGGAPLVTKNSDVYSVASVQAEVQMRQMHRKRKKTP